jgi:predicted TIM-barrel fold metal-dependent hydrolase
MPGAGRATLSTPAWDCHTHVFGPAARFPYAAERRYTPSEASPAALRRVMEELGVQHVVLVQPSPYADDHRCMLEALRTLGRSAVGVGALVNELDRKIVGHPQISGLRVNVHAITDVHEIRRRLDTASQAAKEHGWHLELHVRGRLLPELALHAMPVPLVLDHMARIESAEGAPAEALQRLLDTGRCWVKLSGADRVGAHAPSVARMLLAARPDRLVWGSDWPHTPLEAARQQSRSVDNAGLLTALREWAGASAMLERVLVRNPGQLYGQRAC